MLFSFEKSIQIRWLTSLLLHVYHAQNDAIGEHIRQNGLPEKNLSSGEWSFLESRESVEKFLSENASILSLIRGRFTEEEFYASFLFAQFILLNEEERLWFSSSVEPADECSSLRLRIRLEMARCSTFEKFQVAVTRNVAERRLLPVLRNK